MGKGYLVLENGRIFEGESFGSEKDVSGEVVFNTGMVGYPEGFTDPSYYGQILTMTYPLIGNYGVPEKKFWESKRLQIRGLLVSCYIENKTHWQAKETLSEWLRRERVPALLGIDTRTLTQILREFGVMKGQITFEKPRRTSGNFYDINRDNLMPFVSIERIERYGKGKVKILVIDTGVKLNQIRLLLKFDTTIIRVPWDYDPFKSKIDFDAVYICNGPGDARTIKVTVETVKKALKQQIPTFGICLGNQILALAAGADIYKLKYGHRSQNQPVKDEMTNRCYITSQNHGYAVERKTLPKDWEPWFTNLNDHTDEGIRHKKLPFISCQFHPEAAPGPTDTEWIFEYFITEVKRWRKTN